MVRCRRNRKDLGRLATEVASVLRGKNKPTYTPNVDCGDFVIVINADKIELTGNKLDTKKYYNHSGYAGGLRTRTGTCHEGTTIRLNGSKELFTVCYLTQKLGDKMRRHLFVYEGSEHPHTAQKPVELKIKG